METRILHVDMDAFFASVEQAEHPEYREKPLVVVTKIDNPRGVVSSASYEARKYGITAGMPVGEVRKKCPGAVLVAGNYEEYVYVSEKVVDILYRFSPQVMVASIDESFLDITNCISLFGSEDRLALELKKALWNGVNLPCTVGIASNYIVSKIAVKQAKPDGYLSVPPGKDLDFISPLPVRSVPGIGPRAEQIFHSLGVYTIGQIRKFSLEKLEEFFGRAYAFHVYQWARARDVEYLPHTDLPRVISREITFDSDLLFWREIIPKVIKLLEACTYELRQKQMEARRLTLKVRYADFITKTFSCSFSKPTSSDSDFLLTLPSLIEKAKGRRYRVRLVGVMLSELTSLQGQLLLFHSLKEWKVEQGLKCIDKLRERYGFSFIHWASALETSKD